MILWRKTSGIFGYLRLLLIAAGLGIVAAVILSLGPTLVGQFEIMTERANEQGSYIGAIVISVSQTLIILAITGMGGMIAFIGWRMRDRIPSRWMSRDLIDVVSFLLRGLQVILALSAVQEIVCLVNPEHTPSLAVRISPGYSSLSCAICIIADISMIAFCGWVKKRLHKNQ